MSEKAVQYTVRAIPSRVDRALKKKALQRGISLNALLVEVLEAEAGERGTPRSFDDLDALFGSWVRDPAVDRALSEQRRVDPKDWA